MRRLRRSFCFAQALAMAVAVSVLAAVGAVGAVLSADRNTDAVNAANAANAANTANSAGAADSAPVNVEIDLVSFLQTGMKMYARREDTVDTVAPVVTALETQSQLLSRSLPPGTPPPVPGTIGSKEFNAKTFDDTRIRSSAQQVWGCCRVCDAFNSLVEKIPTNSRESLHLTLRQKRRHVDAEWGYEEFQSPSISCCPICPYPLRPTPGQPMKTVSSQMHAEMAGYARGDGPTDAAHAAAGGKDAGGWDLEKEESGEAAAGEGEDGGGDEFLEVNAAIVQSDSDSDSDNDNDNEEEEGAELTRFAGVRSAPAEEAGADGAGAEGAEGAEGTETPEQRMERLARTGAPNARRSSKGRRPLPPPAQPHDPRKDVYGDNMHYNLVSNPGLTFKRLKKGRNVKIGKNKKSTSTAVLRYLWCQ